jgi:enoyl-CoA hydratase/carnithine racemase
MSVEPGKIAVTVDAGIARVLLDRPNKRNAMTAGMWIELREAFDALAQRDDVRIVALRGAGGAFSAGGDLTSVKGADGSESPEYRRLVLQALGAVRECRHPTVAMIDGACFGAGCFLALECDVRYATPESTLAIPSVSYGIEAVPSGLERLVELTGSGAACRFLLGAERWTGSVAQSFGLVDVCSAEAMSDAETYLRSVSSFDRVIVSSTRRAIFRAAGLGAAADTIQIERAGRTT